jgi:hypothetical protein
LQGGTETMAVHNVRVRRNTRNGPQVVGFFETLGKAHTYAAKRAHETGNLFRIERRPAHSSSWETAMELAPETQTPIEAAIARGKLPRVQDAKGRKGQVLSYIRPARAVRVAWLDVDSPGSGEVIAVDQLTLR